jgi:hypothetical protein
LTSPRGAFDPKNNQQGKYDNKECGKESKTQKYFNE